MAGLIAGLLYVAGALLVLGGAFMPVAARVYGRPPAQQAAAVLASPRAWRWHHVLLAAGAAVTAVAAAWEAVGSGSAARVGAACAFGLGGVFFIHFLHDRLFLPPTAWFGSSTGTKRFGAFTVLTAAGLGLGGIAVVQDGSAWGALLAGYAGLLLAVYGFRRDLPPFAHYVGTLGLGLALLP